ncbi:histidine phosphatase family protein [Paenibacillus qinlingensis]|uniref:Phosphoglycerate mutase n=1 Tax=Paenibacillus qinlingensis TaxID=1837343 RepID=A0ABU1P165_9BACL|nr:histidine phosphatase family protein [Paenibacillus qinlingensis]MDR6553488.1 putative phosphoglycerate mutase [Paenibacillus qinlingensis]
MTDTTTIYIIRHGQTTWNVEHRLQGHQDSPLTELGIKQAQWLSEALQHEEIDVMYSSSSDRALQTAEIVRGQRNIAIVQSDALKEINLGDWEGKLQSEVKEEYPEQFDHFWNQPDRFGVPHSETFAEVAERAMTMLQRIHEAHAGKTIAIVTHTVVVKLIMAYYEQRLMKDIWQPPYIHPACLCKIIFTENVPQIILHADIRHYQEAPTID